MILTIALLGLATATFEPTGANFAVNPSLEQWKAGVPVGWTLEEGACDAWAHTTARQSAEHQDEKISLKLRPPADSSHEIRLRQVITLDPAALPLDGRLHVSAAVQTFAPGGVVLSFQYRQRGDEHTETVAAAGTGIWERLTVEFLLPADAEPASLAVSITRAAGQPGDVLIDDVQVRAMTEAAPAPADSDDTPRPARKPHVPHP